MSVSRSTRSAAVCIAAGAVYSALLVVGRLVPRYDCLVLVGIAALVFARLPDMTRRSRAIVLYGVTEILVLSYVLHLWTVGYEGRNAVFGGILPWSDSRDFAEDALRLVHGGWFGEVSSKRPLFTTVFAALLRLSGGGLRLPLACCALAGGFGVALASNEVRRTHGTRSALFVYLLLLFFERRWAGFVQTEQLGFPLGAIGFALVWRAQALRHEDAARARRLLIAALFSLTLGLLARAGAFFVLPALGLWGARSLVPPRRGSRSASPDRSRRVRFLALAAGAVGLGFAINRIVLGATGSGIAFSDYPGIFYGMIHGEDYTYLAATHPGLMDLPIGERTSLAWRLVLADARSAPASVVAGLSRSFASFFVSPHGAFGYVWTNPDDRILEDPALVRDLLASGGPLSIAGYWRRTLGAYSLINAAAMGALAAGFVGSLVWSIAVAFGRRRRDEELSLLRWSIGGVLLSAPFTPAWITSGMQVQTVTLSLVAALPAVVLLARRGVGDAEPSDRSLRALVYAPAAFAGVVLASAAILRATPASKPSCEGGDRIVRILPGDTVEVATERSVSFRDKARADLMTSIGFLSRHNPELTASISPYLDDGARFHAAFEACRSRLVVLVDEERELSADDGWRLVEAAPLASPLVWRVRTSGAASPPANGRSAQSSLRNR